VTTNRKISVTTWSEAHVPVVANRSAHRQFLPPVVIGFAGSLLLHGLVLQTVVLGSRAHKIRPPEVQEPGSSLNKPEAKPADALVFIDLPKTPNTTEEIYEALASVRAAIKDSPIPVTHPDPSPPLAIETLALSDHNESTSSVDSSDGAERARLFGIYSGQIQARIERVWRRPRTPVNDDSDSTKTTNSVEYFQCQVQIVQDSIGNVQEILLPNCNGSVAWQRSLVLAIQQASPLPAPPSPTVFNRTVPLHFVGFAYIDGGSEEGYDTKPDATMSATVDAKTKRIQIPTPLPAHSTL
jgi:hypothetical protein